MNILYVNNNDPFFTLFMILIMFFGGVYGLYLSLYKKEEMGTDTFLRSLLGGIFGVIMAIIFTILELSK